VPIPGRKPRAVLSLLAVRVDRSVSTDELVSLDVHDVDPTTGACTHLNLATGRCALSFLEVDDFTGDLVGQQQSAGGLSRLHGHGRVDAASGGVTSTFRLDFSCDRARDD